MRDPTIPASSTISTEFRGLAEHLGAIELHQVRRQHADRDRGALAELRDGYVRAWADAYREHGRIRGPPHRPRTA